MDADDNSEAELPSKTQRKQEMHALQQLGEKLTGLSKENLQRLPLTPALQNAIVEFKRLPNSHGARRRQLQFIGRLMRDADTPAILTALDKLFDDPQQVARRAQKIDSLCEQILTSGDSAIQNLIDSCPALERQTLRRYFLEYTRADAAARLEIRGKLQLYLTDNMTD